MHLTATRPVVTPPHVPLLLVSEIAEEARENPGDF